MRRFGDAVLRHRGWVGEAEGRRRGGGEGLAYYPPRVPFSHCNQIIARRARLQEASRYVPTITLGLLIGTRCRTQGSRMNPNLQWRICMYVFFMHTQLVYSEMRNLVAVVNIVLGREDAGSFLPVEGALLHHRPISQTQPATPLTHRKKTSPHDKTVSK